MSSKMTLPPPEERFYANVVKMTGLVREIVVAANSNGYKDVTPFMIDLATKYIENTRQTNKFSLIESFINCSHPAKADGSLDHQAWTKIHERDEKFFDDKAFDVFKGLPLECIDAFRKLYRYRDSKGKSIITEAQKKEIIDYFHAFVKIAIKFIHQKREPHLVVDKDGREIVQYKNGSYFKGVKLNDHAARWGVKLF